MGDDLGVPYLGDIPLDGAIVQSGDSGNPLLVSNPESMAAGAYRGIAQRLSDTVESVQSKTLEPFHGAGRPMLVPRSGWKRQSRQTVDPQPLPGFASAIREPSPFFARWSHRCH